MALPYSSDAMLLATLHDIILLGYEPKGLPYRSGFAPRYLKPDAIPDVPYLILQPHMISPQMIFWLGFSCLLVHELDAIQKQEWRLFPVLNKMSDAAAFKWFVALHLPLFFVFLVQLASPTAQLNTMYGFSIFFLVHLGLHLALWRLPHNKFDNVFSQCWIWGAAAFNAACMLMLG